MGSSQDLTDRRRRAGATIVLLVAATIGLLLLMNIVMWLVGASPDPSISVQVVWAVELALVGGLLFLMRNIHSGGRLAVVTGAAVLVAMGVAAGAFAAWHVATVREGHGGAYVVLGAAVWLGVTVPGAIMLWRARS